MILYISVFLAIFIIVVGYLIISDGLKKLKELEKQEEQIIASQKAKNAIEAAEAKSRQKVIVAKRDEPIIYHLQTDPIRYSLFDSNLIKTMILKKLYESLVIDKCNLEEPFYSTFFFILLVLDQNDIFMIAPNAKYFYSNLRDEYNNNTRRRSYMVLELSEIISMTLIAFGEYMRIDTKKLDQQIIIAFCIYALQKADSHETEDILLMIENIIGSDGYKNIVNMVSAIENKEPNAKLINDIFNQAVKRANRCPITDEGILYKCHTINRIEIPQKQLQFIQK